MDRVENVNIQLRPDLGQLKRQIGIDDIALDGEAITAAAHPRDYLTTRVYRLTAIQRQVIFSIQYQGAEFVLKAFSFDFEQRLFAR